MMELGLLTGGSEELVNQLNIKGIIPAIIVILLSWFISGLLSRTLDSLGEKLITRRLLFKQLSVFSRFLIMILTLFAVISLIFELSGQGLSLLADVFFGAGAEEIFLPIFGQESHTNFASAQRVLNQKISPWSLELVAFHPLGTARMSARRRDGVVKPDGRVWGWSGVSVCDGSIFPTSLGVNPQLTTMALATVIARGMV